MRVPVQLPVECGGFDDRTYLSFSHDMSPNGLSLGSNGPFHVGSPCRLSFALPNRHETAEITGQVRWHAGQGRGSRVGIQFSEPIDFSIPFRAADQAVRGLQEHMDSHLGCLHQRLGDACARVNSEGEIIECDERFLSLLGYSKEDVQGHPFSDFVHVDDRHRLSNFLMEAQNSGLSLSSPAAELCRMQPKARRPICWRIRVAPKPPWSTSRQIYIDDMTEELLAVYGEKKKENLYHLEHILRAAVRGFLLKDVVKETCDPLTCLLARLDLLRHKVTLEREKSRAAHIQETPYYLGEIQKAERLVQDLSEQFKYVLENTCYLQPSGISPFDVSQSLERAISILEMCGGLGGDSIRFESPSVLPVMEASEQEFIMIFLIFLLLSRTCLKNVSDRTIKCETVANKKHVIAKISHNGFIRQRKYLDIIFHNEPLQSYFFKSDSVCCMDTLLYYGNLLLKKNKIRTKITNIPGQFNLSLVMPFRAR